MAESQLEGKQTSPQSLEAPRFESGKAMLVAGLREHYTMATLEQIPRLWQRFGPYIGHIPEQVGGVTYGVCFPSPDGFDYLAGIEVRASSVLPEQFSVVTMPVQRYAVFEHLGHVSNLDETCRAIEREWLPKSRYALALGGAGEPGFFERYGEDFDLQVGSGDVEVWVPIR